MNRARTLGMASRTVPFSESVSPPSAATKLRVALVQLGFFRAAFGRHVVEDGEAGRGAHPRSLHAHARLQLLERRRTCGEWPAVPRRTGRLIEQLHHGPQRDAFALEHRSE